MENTTSLLLVKPRVSLTGPVRAFGGTVATICVSRQLTIGAVRSVKSDGVGSLATAEIPSH